MIRDYLGRSFVIDIRNENGAAEKEERSEEKREERGKIS
jgi:hypothetical protein